MSKISLIPAATMRMAAHAAASPSVQKAMIFTVVVSIGLLVARPSQAQTNGSTYEEKILLNSDLEMVGAGVITNSRSVSAGTFTSDLDTIYYSITDRAFTRMTILSSHRRDTTWSEPQVVPFSGLWSDSDPHLTPDGTRMFFISNRPMPGEEFHPDLNIWYVDRRENATWSDPQPVSAEINDPGFENYPSPDANGSLYFGRQGRLFVASLGPDGTYGDVEELPFQGWSPAISPDGRMLVFMKTHPDQPMTTNLWLSINDHGNWSVPKPFDAPVNSFFGETAARITPDGRYLTFSSDRVDMTGGTWPRERQLKTYEEVLAELDGTILNGLRKMYIIDISAIEP